jgi:hypothetical protein
VLFVPLLQFVKNSSFYSTSSFLRFLIFENSSTNNPKRDMSIFQNSVLMLRKIGEGDEARG